LRRSWWCSMKPRSDAVYLRDMLDALAEAGGPIH